MNDIAFWHCASNKPKATEFAIANVRKFHPNAHYHLCVDGQQYNYSELVSKYSCDSFIKYKNSLGGPKQPYGYDDKGVLEFLERFYAACIMCDSSHIMMMEDDVLLVNPVTVDQNWQHACHNVTNDNLMPDRMIEFIRSVSGKEPNIKRYGAGGGSIFNVETFIKEYDNIRYIFKNHLKQIQYQFYPTVGWIDCFMNVYYFLCGHDYTVNPHLIDTNNHRPGFDYDGFLSKLDPKIQIVNNYKRLYFNE